MKRALLLLSIGLSAALGAQIPIPPTPPAGPPVAPPQTPPTAKDLSLYQAWRDANVKTGAPDQRWNDFYAAAAGFQSAEANAKAMPPQPQVDPVMRFLFPPELVMAHQREIGLQDAQRTRLVAAMTAAQGKFTESQWTLSGEQDKLQQLVQGTSVDEAAIQKQLDRILSMEDELKRTQLLLMVRVKNILTPEQQGMLRAFQQPCQPPTKENGLDKIGYAPRKKGDPPPVHVGDLPAAPPSPPSPPCIPQPQRKGPGNDQPR